MPNWNKPVSRLTLLLVVGLSFVGATGRAADVAPVPMAPATIFDSVAKPAEPKGVAFTPAAAERIKRIVAETKSSARAAVRVGVSAGGCRGYTYELGFDENFDATTDLEFKSNGVRLVVAKIAANFLDGTVIDYYASAERQGFTFSNPNEKAIDAAIAKRSAEKSDDRDDLARRLKTSRTERRTLIRHPE